jgi:hypothetical protein
MVIENLKICKSAETNTISSKLLRSEGKTNSLISLDQLILKDELSEQLK